MKTARRASTRRALTLPELLISMVLMTMVAFGAAMIAKAGRIASTQSRNWDFESRTARVALTRIGNALQQANGSNDFPAVVVFPELAHGAAFPNTVCVWRPANGAAPQDPDGLPRTNELLFYFPNPSNLNQLIESRYVYNPQQAPPLSDAAGWSSLIASAKSYDPYGSQTEWVELSDRLRVQPISLGANTTTQACLRFHTHYAPTDADFANYQNNTVSWLELPWPLHRASNNHGFRRVACDVELQIQLGHPDAEPLVVGTTAVASFGVTP